MTNKPIQEDPRGRRTARRSALPVLCLLAALLLCASARAAGGTVHTITKDTDLYTYFKEGKVEDGDILRCQDVVPVAVGMEIDTPWIIDKEVTIEGGRLTIASGGILLGADVTFKNTVLHFGKPICNAIVANGYALTLDNVTAASGGYVFNVFCGTLLPNSTQSIRVPVPGGANTVVLRGNTNLLGGNENVVGPGNIYAGSLALGSMNETVDEDGRPNAYGADPVVSIEDCAESFARRGTVYACGAQQRNPLGVLGQKPTIRVPGDYTVTGAVTVKGGNAILSVDGEDANAVTVVYQGGGNPADKTFQDISGLSVESGALTLTGESWFRRGGSLSVSSGGTVNLKNLDPILSVPEFRGGGSLILGKNQTLTVTGGVTGETTVGVDRIFNGFSGLPAYGHTYIAAPHSTEASFRLAPPNIPNPPLLKRDSGGNWTAVLPAQEVSRLVSLRPENTRVESGETEIQIPLNPEYTGNGLSLGELLPSIQIQVNGQRAAFVEDAEYPEYSYFQAGGLHLYIGSYDEGESFAICAAENSYTDPVPDGGYAIQITVPGSGHTVQGRDVTASCFLAVGGETAVLLPSPGGGSTVQYLGETPLPAGTRSFAVRLDGGRMAESASGTVSGENGLISFDALLSRGQKLFFLDPDTFIPLAKPTVLQ